MATIKGVNCIVDTNYILYKNVYTLAKNKTLYGDLERSLELSFNNFLTMYPFRKVYMVCDSKKSWRKDIYQEYKAHRKELREKQEVDWDFVYNTYDEFKRNFRHKRVEYVEIDKLEGDDLINNLVKKSNSQSISTIIIASDGDLNQLLDCDINKGYINIQWRENYVNGKVYLPSGYKLFINSVKNNTGDLFNMNQNDDFMTLYNSIIEKDVYEEVDIETLLFTKIISGDKKDNVKSVLQVPIKKDPTKFRGIGDAGAKKILEKFKSEHPNDIDFKSDSWIENVVDFVAENKKVDNDENYHEIVDNIKLNRRLICLDEVYLPQEIKNKIKEI